MSEIETQEPVVGISKPCEFTEDIFRVDCSCSSDYHTHNVWVEADEFGYVNVSIDMKFISPYSSKYVVYSDNWLIYKASYIFNGFVNRLKILNTVIFKGYVETETTISMTAQQAHNYAEYLKKCVKRVQEEKKKQKRD